MLNLLAQIEFEFPACLAGLGLLPLLAYFAWRSRTGQPPGRRLSWLLCRGLAVSLLVFALSGITYRSESGQRLVVLAVDVSRSVLDAGREAADRYLAAAAAGRGPDSIAVLPFAAQPAEIDFSGRLDPAGVDPLDSDPAAALLAAAATVPADYVPRIVLLTDGLETRGDLAAAALGAEAPVDVVPLQPFNAPEACVSELLASGPAAGADEVRLEVVVLANHEGPAQLQIERDGQLAATREVPLGLGENRIPVSVALGGADSSLFQARVTAAWDTISENNRRRTRVFAPPRLRILVIQSAPQTPGDFVSGLAGTRATVDIRSPEQLPEDPEFLDSYGVIVLAGVAPDQLSPAAGTALTRYVQDLGGGLIVAGGEATFSPSVYAGSTLERLLPVTAVAAVEAKPPVLALLLVIDRSASMVEENRLELAKEAARQSVQLLQPHDQAGVMAFSDAPLWVAEIAAVENRDRLLEQIETLSPGGQTNMYQAVERAFLALEQTDADRRYMILLTDGIPAPGNYREIARRMAERDITLSTVSISPGAEQDLLLEMARIAGGRHYHCDDPADVPAILVRETRAATSEDGAESFLPSVFRALPGLDVTSAPPLSGYALTNPKPEAEQLLMAAGRDPLLAWWRCGDGMAVAWTSQPDAPALQAWPQRTAFWQRLIRHVARRAAPPPVRWQARRAGNEAIVTAELDGAQIGLAASADPPQMTVTVPDGSRPASAARVVGPGRYQIRFAVPEEGEYRVDMSPADATAALAFNSYSLLVDYPAELRLQPVAEAELRAVALATGGRYNPPPEELLAADGRTVPRSTRLWRPLLLAALFLFLADVAIRRRGRARRDTLRG